MIGRGHAYAAEDGSGDVYFDVRSWPAYGELTHQALDDMEAAERRRPARQARPARLRAVEGLEEGVRARDRGLAVAVGPGTPGLAHRVLGDGREVPRRGVRHPRRRGRPPLPAPRERAGPVPRGGAPVRVVLDAQRLDHHRRREDEQVARQLPADPGRTRAGARDRAALLHGRRALPLARRVLLRGARRGGGRLPPDRELPGAGGDRARRAGPVHDSPGRLRRGHGRRPGYAGRGGGVVRRGARGQPAADRGRRPTGCERWLGRSGDAGRARARPGGPGLGSAGRSDVSAGQRRRRAGRRPARAAGRGALPARTSPPPTRSATRSRPPASRSRTPRPDRSGTSPRGPADVPGNSQAQRGGTQVVQGTDRRLGWAGPARPRGQGTDPEGEGPALPPAVQASGRRPSARPRRARSVVPARAIPSGWPAATPSWRRCAPGSR